MDARKVKQIVYNLLKSRGYRLTGTKRRGGTGDRRSRKPSALTCQFSAASSRTAAFERVHQEMPWLGAHEFVRGDVNTELRAGRSVNQGRGEPAVGLIGSLQRLGGFQQRPDGVQRHPGAVARIEADTDEFVDVDDSTVVGSYTTHTWAAGGAC